MERVAGRVILLWGWQRALAGFLAGALGAFAQAPFDFPAALFVAFPVLVWLLDGSAVHAGARWPRRLAGPFAIGWCFGFGYFLTGLWWIGNALLVEAEAFAWALPLAVVGLPALLAVFYGLATALARLVWSDGTGRIAALAFGFGLAEWLRSFILTGFPWNAVGYAAMPVPLLMQSIGIVGVFGMNALAVFVFSMPAVLADRRARVIGPALAVLLVAAHAGYGWSRIASAQAAGEPAVSVRIVQPSIDQSEKWDEAARERIFATYLELTASPPAEGEDMPGLVVWPETAVPFLFTDRPDALAALGETLAAGQTLLAGAVRLEGSPQPGAGRYYNSLLAIDAGGEIVDAFDKVHLVPFGEYMPLGHLIERFGIGHIVQAGGPFEPGAQRRLMDAGGVRVLPFICYEIIFPGSAGEAGEGADLLVNVTNDAWFGITPGPFQHFRQAQLRAVEVGRPLVRAANNGISGVVDSYGRVVDAFALDAVGALDVKVPSHAVGTSAWNPTYAGQGIILLFGLLAVIWRPLRRERH